MRTTMALSELALRQAEREAAAREKVRVEMKELQAALEEKDVRIRQL